MTHARRLLPLMLALFAVLLACRKTPSATIEPTDTSEPVASGTIMDAATRKGAVSTEPPVLDAAHVAELGAWVSANVEGPRYQVPVERVDLAMGPFDARVTFVVFTDYQCPYCKKLDDELRKLREAYPNDVRVVVKHFPLAMHQRARIAARAQIAANVQGRGEAMHELLFANARTLDDATLQDLARQAGVSDVARFWADVQDGFGESQIDADLGLGERLAVGSTPTYFVNGVVHKGAKTVLDLDDIYQAEIATVDRMMAAGAARPEVYAGLMHSAAPTREAEKKKVETRVQPDEDAHYAVPVDNRPSLGPDDALVTIIEFADYECPYCRKVQPTLAAVVKRYGKDVRIVYRHQPLPMHKNAVTAAMAANAAHRQGKFWQMHELLFAAAETKTLGNYEDLAAQLGLDLDQFRRDMADPKLADLITEDQKVGLHFGARGTPTFFINGRYFSGAQPLDKFEALIDEELAAAKAFKKKKKVSGDKLYETMVSGWKTEVDAPPVAEHKRQKIDVRDLPVTGQSKKPKITIVGCIDFDCPYSARGAQNIQQLLADKRYAGQVAYHVAHFPLPMHANADEAARAAIAAHKQGKFWEMHDLLFADRNTRSPADFEALAQQLGLDPTMLTHDSNSADTTNKLDDDKKLCSDLGVSGTPTYFINGRRTRGALSVDMLSQVLDEELAGGFEAKR